MILPSWEILLSNLPVFFGFSQNAETYPEKRSANIISAKYSNVKKIRWDFTNYLSTEVKSLFPL